MHKILSFNENVNDDPEITPKKEDANKHTPNIDDSDCSSLLKQLQNQSEKNERRSYTPLTDDPLKIHLKMQQEAAKEKREKQKAQLKKRMEKLIRKHQKDKSMMISPSTSKYLHNSSGVPPLALLTNQA